MHLKPHWLDGSSRQSQNPIKSEKFPHLLLQRIQQGLWLRLGLRGLVLHRNKSVKLPHGPVTRPLLSIIAWICYPLKIRRLVERSFRQLSHPRLVSSGSSSHGLSWKTLERKAELGLPVTPFLRVFQDSRIPTRFRCMEVMCY